MGHPVEIVKGPTDDYYLLREGRLHRIREEATLRDVGMAHGLCFEDKRDLSPKELNLLIPGPEMPDTTPRIAQSQEDGKLYLIKRIILGVEAESVITKREIPNSETLLALTGDIPNKVFLRQTLDAFKNDPGIPDYYGLVALAASPLLIGGKEWRHQYLLLGKIRRHIPFSTKHRTREIVGEPSDWYSEKQLEQETLEGIPVRSAEWLAELWRKSGER